MKKTLLTTIALLSALSFNSMAECPRFVKVEKTNYMGEGKATKQGDIYINVCKIWYIDDSGSWGADFSGSKAFIYFDFATGQYLHTEYIEVTQTKEELITILNAK